METAVVNSQAPAILAPVDQEILGKVRTIIDGLPQRDLIRDDDYRLWTSEITRRFGDLAVWHATRSGGFGGSQIGALVRNYSGYRADFGGSARDIVNLCLLRTFPDEPTSAMRRGIENEDGHALKFYAKWGVRRDLDAYNKLKSGVGTSVWMRYSPDDVVVPEAGGARWLIDYKAPTEVDPSSEVAFQYACQLHLGRLVCQDNGVRIDGMLLSQFDWADWGLKDDQVPYVPELDQLIIEAGNFYWNDFVMRGVAPDYVRKNRLEGTEGLVKEYGDLSTAYAQLAALSTAMEKSKEKLGKELKEKLSALRFGESKLPFEFATVTAIQQMDVEKLTKVLPAEKIEALTYPGEKTYNTDAMVAYMRQNNIDLAPFVSRSIKLNMPGVYQALVEVGVDADELMKEQLRISVNRDVAKHAENWIDANIVSPNPLFERFLKKKPDDLLGNGIDRLGESAEPGTQRSSMEPGSA